MYTIKKVTGQVDPLHRNAGALWAQAEIADIAFYPWYIKGNKQTTQIRTLYSDTAVFLYFACQDRHSFSRTTTLNGPVWTDSCVEFFAAPEPQAKPNHYFNLEINCCGTILMGYGPHRQERRSITSDLGARIRTVASLTGPTKEESPADTGWTIHAELPFAVLEEIAGIPRPTAGTIWKANFYRCGGTTDQQFAAWADIKTPKPDFHRPEFFKEVVFA